MTNKSRIVIAGKLFKYFCGNLYYGCHCGKTKWMLQLRATPARTNQSLRRG
jgi:hypothetical protein